MEKIEKRSGLPQWNPWDRYVPVVFFGMYHIGDYLRFLWHRGEKTVYWLGGDIINLSKTRALVFRFIKARHLCENEPQRKRLEDCGIEAEVRPVIFDDPDIGVSFKPSKNPHVYLNAHPDSKQAYGVDIVEVIAHKLPEFTFHIYGIKKGFHQAWYDNGRLMNRDYVSQPNVIYHGLVSNEQFNQEIRNYQAGLRLNEYDGFSEILAKSVLMGQYPISRIKYPHIENYTSTEDLIHKLQLIKNKLKPNHEAREYWMKQLCKPLL